MPWFMAHSVISMPDLIGAGLLMAAAVIGCTVLSAALPLVLL